MSRNFIYPLYTAILAIILIVMVSKDRIKELSKYAILFGAVEDVVAISIVSKLLNLGGHIDFHPYSALGFPFFPPLAWSIWFILFYEFMPNQRGWQIFYVFAAAVTAVFFSNLLQNLGIFVWNKGNFIIPFVIYSTWFWSAKLGKDFLEKYESKS